MTGGSISDEQVVCSPIIPPRCKESEFAPYARNFRATSESISGWKLVLAVAHATVRDELSRESAASSNRVTFLAAVSLCVTTEACRKRKGVFFAMLAQRQYFGELQHTARS